MTSGQRTFFADERHAESIRGLTTPDADEALVKHEMLTHVDVLVTDDAVTPEQCERLLAVDVTVEVAR
jgi:hypothetical protein